MSDEAAARRRFFHEYPQIFDQPHKGQNRSRFFGRDFSRKNFCICGEDFLSFAKEHFPDLMDEPTPQMLENALLTLVREFSYRKKFSVRHKLNFCLWDCFEELSELINDKLEELHRLPQRSATAALFLGDEPTETDEETE